MNGPIREGTFTTSEGEFVKIEVQHYPKKRFVLRRLKRNEQGAHVYADNDLRPVSPEVWTGLETWL